MIAKDQEGMKPVCHVRKVERKGKEESGRKSILKPVKAKR